MLCKVTASHCTTLPLYNCTHHREMLHDSFTKTLKTEYTQEPPTRGFHIHSRHILIFNVCPSVIELKIQSHNLFLQLFTTFHNLPQSFLKQLSSATFTSTAALQSAILLQNCCSYMVLVFYVLLCYELYQYQ